jgi:Flp pilus assembly pilin Flp
METYKDLVAQILRDEDGQDMVEYVLIMGLISILAVAAVTATGLSIQTLWNTISAGVAAA